MDSVVSRDESVHAERRVRWQGRTQRCIVHCRLIFSIDAERVRLKESKRMNLHAGSRDDSSMTPSFPDGNVNDTVRKTRKGKEAGSGRREAESRHRCTHRKQLFSNPDRWDRYV